MLAFIRFWLILELLGLAAWPLAWRLFRPLPGQGIPFAKALGLLLAGYVLWLGASLGLLRNTVGGSILAGIIVAALSAGLVRQTWRAWLADVRAHWRFALGIEGLFLFIMAGWAYFRAFNPDIAGTEKPMEVAFIQGVFHSATFPPRDPWLAGYGISYYYFGYVLINMLAKLAGVMPTEAFNLGLAAIVAFAFTEPLGLIYALVRKDDRAGRGRASWAAWGYGLLGGVFVAFMGNLEVLLEMLHARGWLSPTLMGFFDIKELDTAPITGRFNPDSGGWWWWRASRVIHDYNLAHTGSQEVIDEFPQFSFILGDMHPHVLAIPFAFLMMALALALFWRRTPEREEETPSVWVRVKDAFGLGGWGLPLTGLLVGAMGFLNTWDFPIYLFLLTLAFALRRGYEGARIRARFWKEMGVAFFSLALAGVLFYLPFYLSFSSQAGGILPNVANPTRFVQYFIMFGTFLTALFFLLVTAWARYRPSVRPFIRWFMAFLLIPAGFLALAMALVWVLPGLRARVAALLGGEPTALLKAIVAVRLTTPFTWLILAALLAAVATLLGQVWQGQHKEEGQKRPSPSLAFALILFGLGLLLTYAVEFVYLKDSFGTRMNTVFKFYYQAWLLMSVAAAYGLFYIQTRARGGLKVLGIGLTLLLTAVGLFYPAFAIPSKANHFQGEPTLDGAAFIQRYQPELYQVIQWVDAHAAPDAVLVEAPGRSYSDDDFISAFTGRATLLGWGGHELQWRGNYEEPGRREPLIQALYQNRDPEQVKAIVQEFGIRYLVVGPKERTRYHITPPIEKSYLKLWEPVFSAGPYTIYRWRGD